MNITTCDEKECLKDQVSSLQLENLRLQREIERLTGKKTANPGVTAPSPSSHPPTCTHHKSPRPPRPDVGQKILSKNDSVEIIVGRGPDEKLSLSVISAVQFDDDTGLVGPNTTPAEGNHSSGRPSSSHQTGLQEPSSHLCVVEWRADNIPVIIPSHAEIVRADPTDADGEATPTPEVETLEQRRSSASTRRSSARRTSRKTMAESRTSQTQQLSRASMARRASQQARWASREARRTSQKAVDEDLISGQSQPEPQKAESADEKEAVGPHPDSQSPGDDGAEGSTASNNDAPKDSGKGADHQGYQNKSTEEDYLVLPRPSSSNDYLRLRPPPICTCPGGKPKKKKKKLCCPCGEALRSAEEPKPCTCKKKNPNRNRNRAVAAASAPSPQSRVMRYRMV